MSSTDDVVAGDVAPADAAARPARRPMSRLFVGLLIAALVLVSASLGAGVTAIVAAGAARDARVAAARELAEMQGARMLAEVKADACLAAFAYDRAALEAMAESAGDLNSALRTLDESGWPAALALVGSATEHLEESKRSIAQANSAQCTE